MNMIKMGGLAFKACVGTFLILITITSSALAATSASVIPTSAGYITLNSFSGHPGVTLTTSGGGWSANVKLNVFAGTISGTPLGTATTNASGEFSTTVTVPNNSVQGPLAIIAVDPVNNKSQNSYYVIPFSPTITIAAGSHTPYATVNVTGAGYAPNENIILSFGSGATASVTADAQGNFTNGSVKIPNLPSGLYHLSATGESSGATNFDYFWVDMFYASVYPSAYYLEAGKTLTFSGSGFASGENVEVRLGADATTASLSTFVTDMLGNFKDTGAVLADSDSAGGTATYFLKGLTSLAQTSISIAIGKYYPQISPSDYYVSGNSITKITGSNFAPNETVTLSVKNNNSSSFSTTTTSVTSALGILDANVFVPFGGNGATISAVGSKSKTPASVGITLATFYPSLSSSQYYLNQGSSLILNGSGFVPLETITIKGAGVTSMTLTADSLGKFVSDSITIPYGTKSPSIYTAQGNLSNTISSVSIGLGAPQPLINSDAYFANPGQNISVYGVSFGANETVKVIAGSFSTTVVANATGTTPKVTIPVPYNLSAPLSVVMTGLSSGVSATLAISVGSLTTSVTPNTYFSSPGGTVIFTGTGYAPNESVNILMNGATVTTITTQSTGGFTYNTDLPYNVPGPIHFMFNSLTTGKSSTVDIGVSALQISVTPSTYFATPGSVIVFTGKGFKPGETISVKINGTSNTTITATTLGDFSYETTIPYNMPNTLTYSFKGATTGVDFPLSIGVSSFSSYFNLSTYYANGGSAETYSGGGFAPNESVSITYSASGSNTTAPVVTTVADKNGAFSVTNIVPYGTSGQKVFKATGFTSGASAMATFTQSPVYTTLFLANYASAPGTTITFKGSGYLPNETINLTTDRTGSTVIHTFVADSSGNINNSGFIIPNTFVEGNLSLTVIGTHSFDPKTIVYYVTGK